MLSTHPSKIFALVDCNSFYCSCERVFEPQLKYKPVVVLSNNDGCIVSLTHEAKAIGLRMGEPIFKQRDLVKKHQVRIFSSNYTLYGDMSSRVMRTLTEFTPELEIYSIDEAFLNLAGFEARNLTLYGQEIRKRIAQYTGIPVSVGIGPSKVLAKIANKIAKKNQSGVVDICHLEVQESILNNFRIGDIWGIGKQSESKLNKIGIMTALEFRNAYPRTIQDLLGIVGVRIQNELKGQSCINLELTNPNKKQIISSRSFGKPISDKNTIAQAISNHVTRACEKLRLQKSVCYLIQVFIHTNRFKKSPQYYNIASKSFLTGEDSTNRVITAALGAFDEIYAEGFEYKKCGIILSEIHSKNETQMGLFDLTDRSKNDLLMATIDKINKNIGKDVLKFASCGTHPHWQMLSEHRSKRFTTHWNEILNVVK